MMRRCHSTGMPFSSRFDLGSAELSHVWPLGADGLMICANRRAPTAFRAPAPWASVSKPGSTSAVNCRAILTAFDDSRGLAVNINAAAPATRGDAILVPDSCRYDSKPALSRRPRTTRLVLPDSLLPLASSDTTLTPSAIRSGLARRSKRDGPRELKSATRSSSKAAVPVVSSAPTHTAEGELQGTPTPPKPGLPVSGLMPILPAAVTTTMPLRDSRSTACTIGSLTTDSNTG